MSNPKVRHKILGKDGKCIDDVVNLHRLRWLGHVLRVPDHFLARQAMLSSVGVDWETAIGG